MNKQKHAYQLLQSRRVTISQIAQRLRVTEKQVLAWCAAESLLVAQIDAAITATDASRYEHQTGRQKERVKAE